MPKTVDVPDLVHDVVMFAKYGHKVSPNGRLERRLVAALCAHLAEHGWLPVLVYDGDVLTPVTDAKSAMELIFNLDDAWLYFANSAGDKHWVRIVLGNGVDLFVDHSYSGKDTCPFLAAMDAFDTLEYA